MAVTARIQRADGRVDVRDVRAGEQLATGDGVKVQVGSERRAYVYVVAVGASGSAVLLHPFSGNPSQALVQASGRVSIPSGSAYMPLVRDTGRETIAAVASRSPVRDIDALLTRAEDAVAAGDDVARALATFGDVTVKSFIHGPGIPAADGVARSAPALFGGQQSDPGVLGGSGSRIAALLAGKSVSPLATPEANELAPAGQADSDSQGGALASLFGDSPSPGPRTAPAAEVADASDDSAGSDGGSILGRLFGAGDDARSPSARPAADTTTDRLADVVPADAPRAAAPVQPTATQPTPVPGQTISPGRVRTPVPRPAEEPIVAAPAPSAPQQPLPGRSVQGRPAVELAAVEPARPDPAPVSPDIVLPAEPADSRPAVEPAAKTSDGGGFFSRLGGLFGASTDEAGDAEVSTPAPAARTFAVPETTNTGTTNAAATTPGSTTPGTTTPGTTTPGTTTSGTTTSGTTTSGADTTTSVAVPTVVDARHVDDSSVATDSAATDSPSSREPAVPPRPGVLERRPVPASDDVLGGSGSRISALLGRSSETVTADRTRVTPPVEVAPRVRASTAAGSGSSPALDVARSDSGPGTSRSSASRRAPLPSAPTASAPVTSGPVAPAPINPEPVTFERVAQPPSPVLSRSTETTPKPVAAPAPELASPVSVKPPKQETSFLASLFGSAESSDDGQARDVSSVPTGAPSKQAAGNDQAPPPPAGAIGTAAPPAATAQGSVSSPVAVDAPVASGTEAPAVATSPPEQPSILATLFGGGSASAPETPAESRTVLPAATVEPPPSAAGISLADEDVNKSTSGARLPASAEPAADDDRSGTGTSTGPATVVSSAASDQAASDTGSAIGQRTTEQRATGTSSTGTSLTGTSSTGTSKSDASEPAGGGGAFAALLGLFSGSTEGQSTEAPEPGSEAARVAEESAAEEAADAAEGDAVAGGGLLGFLFGGSSEGSSPSTSGVAVAANAEQPSVTPRQPAAAPAAVPALPGDSSRRRSLPQIGGEPGASSRPRPSNDVLGGSGSRIARLLGEEPADASVARSAPIEDRAPVAVATAEPAPAPASATAVPDSRTPAPEPLTLAPVSAATTVDQDTPVAPAVSSAVVSAPSAPPVTVSQSATLPTVTAAIPERPAITVKPQPEVGALALTPSQAQLELDPLGDGLIPRALVLIVTPRGIGSGVLVDRDGHVLTNWHTVNGFNRVSVWLKAPGTGVADLGTPRAARLVRSNRSSDLALLQLEDVPTDVEPIPIAGELGAGRGDIVYLVSHFGGSEWRYAPGRFVNVKPKHSWLTGGRYVHKGRVVRTRVGTRPTSSGGALLNGQLEMIGLNAHVARRSPDVYSVDIDAVRRFLAGELAPDPGGG